MPSLADFLALAAYSIADFEPEPMSPYDGSVYAAALEAQQHRDEVAA